MSDIFLTRDFSKTATELASTRMIGLSPTNANADYTTIAYAFNQYYYAALNVYESGVSKNGSVAYAAGDVLKIERLEGIIRYYKNGVLFYTSATPSTSALLIDASFYTEAAGVQYLRTSFIKKTSTVMRNFDYDHAGRLLKTWHSLNGATPVILSQNEYNELGQLITKKLHATTDPLVGKSGVVSGVDNIVSNAYNNEKAMIAGTSVTLQTGFTVPPGKNFTARTQLTSWNGSNLTPANGSFAQVVNYKYNIRGWLTKINNSDVSTGTAGDPRDLFGMELFYNNVDGGITNGGAFNGNISAVKWSKDQSLGTKKENAYTYNYDLMNRITGATFKEKSGSWGLATSSGFSESGYTYDLNGNIKSLQRYDKRGSTAPLDDMVYYYGTTTTNPTSNKLLKVVDNGDAFGGFVDGTNGGDDYTYDDNGNMITDQNKGITTAIAYNHLNLPQTVSKGGNSVSYLYDASGRKLSQVTTFYGSQKQVDYSGEFQYENDVMQFVGHEEGRVVLASTENVFTDDATVVNNFTAVNATLSAVTQNGAEKYVKATITDASGRPGVFPVGGTTPVTGGERYKVRVRGYRTKGTAAICCSNPAFLLVQASGTDLTWGEASLPDGSVSATTESWTERIVTIPAGATTLQAGVGYDNAHVATGETIYINDFEITKLTTNTVPEYQYNLKDHLGNVRVSFTTKADFKTTTAAAVDGSNLLLLNYDFVPQ